MAQLITLIVVLGTLALILTRIRAGALHFRFGEWPLGQQIEAGLALLFALLAALAAAAGEYGFASWLVSMAALLAAFAVLTWPKSG
ncbi:hypothetical protein [Sinimarinibacterium thermocellulolyticum]|uniref:Uncharacterized protein n=1 Tax=Sinimarinibacterium thermocellulolyticum TaxID=3170016 RepID=A0ABV2A9A6_9GAMM